MARFQLFIKSPCNNDINLVLNRNTVPSDYPSYYLEGVSQLKHNQYRADKNGTIELPDTGTYELHIYENIESPIYEIKIKDSSLYTYVYNEPKIIFRCLGDPGCFYYSCDSLANGYQEDYYKNGNIKLRGTFAQGKIKDSVVTFYQNGITKSRWFCFPKSRVLYEFDSGGHRSIIDRYTHFHEWSMVYSGPTYNHRKEYFSNGKIKLNEFLIDDDPYRIKEFDENGNLRVKQTKKSRTEYLENGIVKTNYNWTFKKSEIEDEKNSYDITVHKIEYDSSSKIIEEQVYEKTGLRYKIPIFDIKRSDWIDSWVKFENGKKIVVANDENPDNFFKKK